MKKQLLIILTTIIVVSTYAVVQIGEIGATSTATASYITDVRPILESRCANCHMGEFVSEGLDMNTYESLMAGSQNGPVIAPGDANNSLLVEKITEGKMPKRGPKLTPAQIQIIKDWINSGALDN